MNEVGNITGINITFLIYVICCPFVVLSLKMYEYFQQKKLTRSGVYVDAFAAIKGIK